MAMQVALAHYDVRNGSKGVKVFVDLEKAIDAVIDWVQEANLIGQSSLQMCEARARDALRRGEGLAFETMECYYSVEMQDVEGAPAEDAASRVETAVATGG